MSGPDFEFVDDVTSDLSFVARGEDLTALFRAAAAALLEATLEDPAAVGDAGDAEVRRLELEEPDAELLLLRFLNELVYLRDAEGLLLRPRELHVEVVDDAARLRAELAGERVDPVRHRWGSEVKAATAHGLALVREGDGWRVTVTLDV